MSNHEKTADDLCKAFLQKFKRNGFEYMDLCETAGVPAHVARATFWAAMLETVAASLAVTSNIEPAVAGEILARGIAVVREGVEALAAAAKH